MVKGMAAEGMALVAQGFRSANAVGGSPSPGGATVHFRPGDDAKARTVAAAFPGATLKEDATVGDRIVVHLGGSAPTVVEVPNRVGDQPLPRASITIPPTPGSVVTGRRADADICS